MTYRLTFACGATMQLDAPFEVGRRMVTWTSPHQGHQRPVHPDNPEWRMHCLLFCPAAVRRSGRKVQEGWFEPPHSAGKPGRIVTCKVLECELEETQG